MLRKETAFPRWTAMDRRWNKNTVSLLSKVTSVIRLPISCTSSTAIWFHVPAAHQHKAAGRKTRQHTKLWLQQQFTLLPWCCGKKPHFLFAETGKALEKECRLPGVFCDGGDTPANLLSELNGHLMPCTSCLYGKWVEDVCTGQSGVFVYLVLCCLVGCCTQCSRKRVQQLKKRKKSCFFWNLKKNVKKRKKT